MMHSFTKLFHNYREGVYANVYTHSVKSFILTLFLYVLTLFLYVYKWLVKLKANKHHQPDLASSHAELAIHAINIYSWRYAEPFVLKEKYINWELGQH